MEIPNYTIIRELSKGGAATVYLAIQERLNRQVALKVIKSILGEDNRFAARFMKEGRIALQLKHPHIITLYDFNSHDYYYYFSMEFLPGGTLSQRIEQGLTAEHALTIVKLIAEALAYAHSQGIIHRSVKPKNILFRQDGTPVLSDFSIAKVLDADATQLTTIGMYIDSPLYMSPEQMEGKPLDARSDLYSLGLVFYEMLTRQLPLQAAHIALPSNFRKFQPIFDKLLAKNPEDRFTNADQLIAAIAQIELVQYPDPKTDRLSKPIVSSASDTSRTLNLRSKGSTLAISSVALGTPFNEPTRSRSRIALTVSNWSALTIVIVISGYLIMTHQDQATPPYSTETNVQPSSVLEDRSAAAIHYERLAQDHFQRGEWQSSLAFIQLGLNVAPNDRHLLELRTQAQRNQQVADLLAQAREYHQQGALEESLKWIDQGLRLMPEQPDLMKLRDQIEVDAKLEYIANQYVDWAKDALAQGDLNKAESYLTQLAQIKPEHPKFSILKQDLQARRNQIATARRQTEEAARRQAAEELKRRMDTEAKRQAEAEAKRQIDQEAKRKAAERVRRPAAEEPKPQTAASETVASHRRRCSDILSRLTLGEPMSDGERTFLTQRCK